MFTRIAKSLAVIALLSGTAAMAQEVGITGNGVSGSGISGVSGISGGLGIDFAAGNVRTPEKGGGLANAIDTAIDGEANKASSDCGNKLRCDD